MTYSERTERAVAVLRELAGVLETEANRIDGKEFDSFVDCLLVARRVIFFGAGRSGSIALAFAQRMTHVGLSVSLVGEAGNSRCAPEDAVVVISGSGATPSALTIVEEAKKGGCGSVCLLTASPSGHATVRADIVVHLHGKSKGDPMRVALAPYTAQFDLSVLALSECVARAIMDSRGLSESDIESMRPNVE